MLNIAICDDDKTFINYIEGVIESCSVRYEEKFNIKTFSDGSKLIDYMLIDQKNFDIILLDMQMKDLDGIQTARKIRKQNKNTIIIFVTSYTNMVYDAFEVKAFRYLLKSKVEEQLDNILKEAIEEIGEDKRNLFVFSFQSTNHMIPFQDIIYFESKKRSIYVYTKDREFNYYGKLRDVEEQTKDMNFIRSHQSFLVNLKHVEEIKGFEIVLDTKQVLPISKSKVKDINRAFTWSLR